MGKDIEKDPVLPPGYRLCRQWQDAAKKWRVQVQVDAVGNTELLKFEKEPTEDQVKASCAGLLANQATAKALADADQAAKTVEAEKLALVKDIPLADLKTKLTAVAVVVKS